MTDQTRRLTTRAALNLTVEDPLNSTAWRDQAECRTVDPELFFPHSTTTEQGRRQTEVAKRVCHNCLVREQCLEWALETRQDVGVWGGMSEDERRKMHRRLPVDHKARRTKAADHILDVQRAEFLECVGRGLTPMEIAKELGTNVQTVKTVRERLELEQEQGQAAAGTSTVAVAV